jgi:hypothetical protein
MTPQQTVEARNKNRLTEPRRLVEQQERESGEATTAYSPRTTARLDDLTASEEPALRQVAAVVNVEVVVQADKPSLPGSRGRVVGTDAPAPVPRQAPRPQTHLLRGTGDRLGLLASATVGEGDWVGLTRGDFRQGGGCVDRRAGTAVVVHVCKGRRFNRRCFFATG